MLGQGFFGGGYFAGLGGGAPSIPDGPHIARTYSGTLLDKDANIVASIRNIRYRFWDNVSGLVTDTGQFDTDGQGHFTLTFAHSTLNSGDTGWLQIDDSNGNPGPHRAYFGPVTVS